ncbi:MAG: hypothetical protein IPK20_17985 [Betaproteobacteria bacterium]|nr:hypothetical protein [Betaproteobacteria bacterium]
MDSTTATVAQVNMSGGTLTLSGNYVVGLSGSGTALQSGGALTASSLQLGPYAGTSGSFTFSGASSTMALSQLYVGVRGNGSFLMGNGTATLSSQFILGYFDTATNASFIQNGERSPPPPRSSAWTAARASSKRRALTRSPGPYTWATAQVARVATR